MLDTIFLRLILCRRYMPKNMTVPQKSISPNLNAHVLYLHAAPFPLNMMPRHLYL